MGHDPNICSSLGRAFEVLGKRWTGVILGVLLGGPAGFAAIKRDVGGITDSVLSDRLSELTELGLVERTVVTDTRPPGVQYELTEAGLAMQPALDQLASWAREHLAAPVA